MHRQDDRGTRGLPGCFDHSEAAARRRLRLPTVSGHHVSSPSAPEFYLIGLGANRRISDDPAQ